MTRPRLRDGFLAIGFGFRFLLRSPRTWPFALVPAVVFLTLALSTTALSVYVIRPWLSGAVGPATGVNWAGTVVGWLGAVAAGLLGMLLSLAITPPLSAPALEHIVGEVERELGAPERPALGFWTEVWFGIKAQALVACVAGPLLALLWIVNFAFPPAQVVTIPLKLFVAALALSWNLLDYPLTLHGWPMRRRLRLLWDNLRSVSAFGALFALLFWIPCFPILMLPVGVAAATRLLCQLRAADDRAKQLPASRDGDPNLLS